MAYPAEKLAIVCLVNVGKVLLHCTADAPALLVPAAPALLPTLVPAWPALSLVPPLAVVVPLDPALAGVPPDAATVAPALFAFPDAPPELIMPAAPLLGPTSEGARLEQALTTISDAPRINRARLVMAVDATQRRELRKTRSTKFRPAGGYISALKTKS